MAENLNHTPGEPFSELDPTRPGWAIVRAREGNSVHELARCHSHDAPLIARARELPHQCGHEGCPGRLHAERLAKLDVVITNARDVVAAFGTFEFSALQAAIGPAKAQALWSAVAALDQATGRT